MPLDGEASPDMPAELKKMHADINSALDQLGKAVDAKNSDTVRRLTDHITKYSDEAEKWTNEKKAFAEKAAAAEKKAEEAERRVKDLEQKVAIGGIGHNGGPNLDDGSPNPNAPERLAPEYKAFFDFVRAKNVDMVAPETKALLRTDQDVAGGYLVPPVTDSVIRKKVVEMSPVRAFATSRTMTTKTMNIPKRTALLDSSYEGEGESDTQDASKYGDESVTAWRHQVTVPITLDQLLMSPFNMEGEISSDVGQSFAKKEGKLFLTGSGKKMPEGITVNPDVLAGKVVSGATGIITFDDIATLIGKMKSGYNPMLYFNRLTFSILIQLKDSYGRPLWQPVAGDQPATIWDNPYSKSFIDMDSMIPPTYTSGALTANATSGTIPIMFADLRQGYEIFDLMGMSVVRDDVTRKRNAIIEYTFRRYNTARVLMPEAIKLLKVA
jgi:HK97 family phage major capsid protein